VNLARSHVPKQPHKQNKKKPNKTKNKRKNTKNKTILEENIKKYINKKNIPEHLRICQSVVEKDQIYKIEKFDNVFSIDESFVFT
jgi:hypothetical protein